MNDDKHEKDLNATKLTYCDGPEATTSDGC